MGFLLFAMPTARQAFGLPDGFGDIFITCRMGIGNRAQGLPKPAS